MNADMLNRGTEDPPLSLSFFRGGGGERSLRPPLDPLLINTCILHMFRKCLIYMADSFPSIFVHWSRIPREQLIIM
jgi:hypothetical protein